MPNKSIKIFLASSSELKEDREQFRIFISVENDRLHTQGIYLELVQWEYFMDAISDTRLQNEYNTALKNCDIAVCLFFTKVGKYTAEEFDTAYQTFKVIGKPKIWTYFKDGPVNTGIITDTLLTLLNFKKKLSDLGHFYTIYTGIDNLKYHFKTQLDKILPDVISEVSAEKEENVPSSVNLITIQNSKNPVIHSSISGQNVQIGDNIYHIYESREKQVKFPTGFSLLIPPKPESVSASKIKYQDYLQSNNLPYISRDNFKNNNKELENFITETTVVQNVLNSEIYDGGIIFGEGGIGKTRFMLEMGQLALADGWIVLRVNPSVSTIEELKPYLLTKHKYLLLFDYIEESKSFSSDIVNQLKGDDDDFTLKVLANCRYTYRSSSKFPSADDFFPVEFRDDAEQKAYEIYVTGKILKEVKENLTIKSKGFFSMKVSFAVFLRFLLYSQKVKTSDVREVNSFKEWIKKRLCLTFGVKAFSDIDEQIFYLLALMPANNEQTEIFYEEPKLKAAIQKLKADGWIEETENDSLRVIHDTIVDEVLIIHFDITHDAKREIKSLLKFAIHFKKSANFLRSLERIMGHSIMPDKGYFYQLFSEGIQKQPNDFDMIKNMFGVTSLLDEGNRIDLLTNNAIFFKDYIEDINFGKSLSFILNFASKSKILEDKKDILGTVFNIWYEKNPNFLNHSGIAYRHGFFTKSLLGQKQYKDSVPLRTLFLT
jgi:hypothetical protein